MDARRSSATLIVRGQGRNLFAGAAIITVLAVVVPAVLSITGRPPPLQNVQRIWLVVAAVTVLLVAAGIFYASRRVELSGRSLRISSVFGQRCASADEVSDITIQALGGIGDNDYPADYLTLWCGQAVWVRLDLRTWNRADLAQLVQELVRIRPLIQVSPEVLRALDMPPIRPERRSTT